MNEEKQWWSMAGAVSQLRTDVNTLTWLHAEQRLVLDAICHAIFSLELDDILNMFHTDLAAEETADDAQRPAESALADRGETES